MSMTQGRVKQGSNLGQLAGVDPRLVAGGARDGGGVRFPSSGDQMAGGGQLRVAGSRPHPFVQTAGAEVARAHRNGVRGGDRSSGQHGHGATLSERAS